MELVREFVDVDTFIENHHHINYCEIIIAPDGKVSYAVPSHQQMLAEIACDRLRVSYEELQEIVPTFVDIVEYLIYMTGGYIPIWSQGFYSYDGMNDNQLRSLGELVKAGLVEYKLFNPSYIDNYQRYISDNERYKDFLKYYHFDRIDWIDSQLEKANNKLPHDLLGKERRLLAECLFEVEMES